jgi:hypothetical protein
MFNCRPILVTFIAVANLRGVDHEGQPVSARRSEATNPALDQVLKHRKIAAVQTMFNGVDGRSTHQLLPLRCDLLEVAIKALVEESKCVGVRG